MVFRSLAIWTLALLAACSSETATDMRIRVGGNSPTGFYAGAAAEKITPEITETFVDLDFAADATGAAEHAGPDGSFSGNLSYPLGDTAHGKEAFTDTNSNGLFDAVWLAGSFGRRPANAVHDDLWARAVAVRSGRVTVIFATVDLMGYFNDEIRAVREEVAKQVEFDQLIVSASHSHETPDLVGIWGPDDGLPGWNPVYRKFVRAHLAKAIIAAAQAAEPVVMGVNSGSIVSPGSPLKPGNMHYDARDPVVIDDSVGVMQFRQAHGDDVIATLVTWAGHPEHMIDDNAISADYVYALRGRLETRYPGSVALFVNGVLGGQIGTNHADVVRGGKHFTGQAGKECREENHPYQLQLMKAKGDCPPGFDFDNPKERAAWMWNKAEAVGLNVADRSIELLEGAEVTNAPAIGVYNRTLFLPVDNKGYRLMILLKTLMDRAIFADESGKEPRGFDDVDINTRVFIRTDVQRVDFTTEDGILLQVLTVPGEMHPELSVGGWDGSKTGGMQPLVDPNNPNPPYPRLADTACAAPPCWDTSKAPKGPYLRERMLGKHNMLFGLTEDEVGYLLPDYNWELSKTSPYLEEAAGDHYEETNSLGPETVRRLFKVYDELLKE